MITMCRSGAPWTEGTGNVNKSPLGKTGMELASEVFTEVQKIYIFPNIKTESVLQKLGIHVTISF